MTIGDRIKFFRQSNNLNQLTFATALGISQTHISKIENNKDFPSSNLLHSIAAYFGLNYEWLETGEGEMYSDMHKHESYTLEQCYMDLQDMQNKFDNKVFEQQLYIIRQVIELLNQSSNFKNFKYFDSIYLSKILSTIHQIQDFFVIIDNKYGNMNASELDYDECALTDNYVNNTLKLYTNEITHDIFEQLIKIIASWDVMSEYIDIEATKEQNMIMLNKNKLKSN